MYPISQTYSEYLRRHDAEYVVKVEINDVEYDSSKIVDFIVDDYITNMDELEIGTAIPSMLTLTLRTNEVIPPNAKIIPYVALSMEGVSWQDADFAWDDADWPWEGGTTDWLPLGEFYVDTREKIHDVWTYTCLDKLVFADVPYVSSLTYPATQKVIWDEICNRLGFTYDSSVVIANYNVPVAPTGYTMRQVMGFIAGANGASVFVGKDGILRFKRYNASDAPQFEMGEADYFRVKQTNPVKSYSRVVVIYDLEDELFYEAGTGNEDHTLYIENPFATQQITNDIYARINGLSYQPIEMDSKGYPQLDQGDIISFEQSESMTWDDAEMSWDEADFAWDGIETYQTIILRQSFGFAGGLKMTLDAPSLSEQQSEFAIEGELTQQVNRLTQSAVRQGKLYYGVTITKEDGLTIERSDSAAKAVFNADELTFYKGSEKALWFDVPNDRYMFSGIIEASDFVGGTIAIGSGNNIFKADSNGIYLGHSSFGSAPFRVNMQGQMVATSGQFSGTISGSTITGGTITIGSGNNVFKVASNGIWAGHSNFNSAPFSVNMQGQMTAMSGTFGGTLQAAGGTFTGTVSAGQFVGGTITGALIQTSVSNYPRIELSSTANILQAFATVDRSINILASVGGTPYLEFSHGAYEGNIWQDDGYLQISSTGDVSITGYQDVDIWPSGNVKVPSWSRFVNKSTGETLQEALDGGGGYSGIIDTIADPVIQVQNGRIVNVFHA